MRTAGKIIAVAAIAGLGLAGCTLPSGNPVTVPTTAPPVTVPPGSPVGFNAARTAFNLPFGLGVLPADELALAKSDPAYAAGLANVNDWRNSTENLVPSMMGSGPILPMAPTWYYVGTTTGSAAAVVDAKNGEIGWNASVVANLGIGQALNAVVHTNPPAIAAHGLHLINTGAVQDWVGTQGGGADFVTPSNLEIQAAPVGNLDAKGVATSAFCTPMPNAFIDSSGQVTVPLGASAITAGPSTVFALAESVAAIAEEPDMNVILYDEGVASCAAFK